MRLRAWISPNPNPPGERAARLGLRARVNQGRGRWPGKGWVKVPILAVTSTVLTPAPPPTPLPTASTTCSADLRAERLRTSLRDRGRLRGGAQREVVVAEEHHDLVRVPQLPREERELAQRHHHLVLNPLRQRAQRALQLLVLSERRRTHQVVAWLRRRVARTPQHLRQRHDTRKSASEGSNGAEPQS